MTEITYAAPRDARNRHRHALDGHVAWGRIYDHPRPGVRVSRWWIEICIGTRYLWVGR